MYNFWTQKLIVEACCIIHNFFVWVDPDESLLLEVDAEMLVTYRAYEQST